MANLKSVIVASALAGALSCLPNATLAQPAAAQSAQDQQALKDYRLTMAVVEKIAKANKAAKQATAKDPKQQRLAKQAAELATLEAKDELTAAEHERMAVLADEIARAEDDESGDDQNGTGSLTDFVRRVDATPSLAAAIRSVGLSSREYATATFALLEAGLADALIEQKMLKQPPPGVSKHNLEFVRQHRAQLSAMGVMTQDED